MQQYFCSYQTRAILLYLLYNLVQVNYLIFVIFSKTKKILTTKNHELWYITMHDIDVNFTRTSPLTLYRVRTGQHSLLARVYMLNVFSKRSFCDKEFWTIE